MHILEILEKTDDHHLLFDGSLATILILISAEVLLASFSVFVLHVTQCIQE